MRTWSVGSTTLAAEEVDEVLERFAIVRIDGADVFDVTGLKPSALLQLWRYGFAPTEDVGE